MATTRIRRALVVIVVVVSCLIFATVIVSHARGIPTSSQVRSNEYYRLIFPRAGHGDLGMGGPTSAFARYQKPTAPTPSHPSHSASLGAPLHASHLVGSGSSAFIPAAGSNAALARLASVAQGSAGAQAPAAAANHPHSSGPPDAYTTEPRPSEHNGEQKQAKDPTDPSSAKGTRAEKISAALKKSWAARRAAAPGGKVCRGPDKDPVGSSRKRSTALHLSHTRKRQARWELLFGETGNPSSSRPGVDDRRLGRASDAGASSSAPRRLLPRAADGDSNFGGPSSAFNRYARPAFVEKRLPGGDEHAQEPAGAAVRPLATPMVGSGASAFRAFQRMNAGPNLSLQPANSGGSSNVPTQTHWQLPQGTAAGEGKPVKAVDVAASQPNGRKGGRARGRGDLNPNESSLRRTAGAKKGWVTRNMNRSKWPMPDLQTDAHISAAREAARREKEAAARRKAWETRRRTGRIGSRGGDKNTELSRKRRADAAIVAWERRRQKSGQTSTAVISGPGAAAPVKSGLPSAASGLNIGKRSELGHQDQPHLSARALTNIGGPTSAFAPYERPPVLTSQQHSEFLSSAAHFSGGVGSRPTQPLVGSGRSAFQSLRALPTAQDDNKGKQVEGSRAGPEPVQGIGAPGKRPRKARQDPEQAKRNRSEAQRRIWEERRQGIRGPRSTYKDPSKARENIRQAALAREARKKQEFAEQASSSATTTSASYKRAPDKNPEQARQRRHDAAVARIAKQKAENRPWGGKNPEETRQKLSSSMKAAVARYQAEGRCWGPGGKSNRQNQ